MGAELRTALDAARRLRFDPEDVARPGRGPGPNAGRDPGRRLRNGEGAAGPGAEVSWREGRWGRRGAADGQTRGPPAAPGISDPRPGGERRGPAVRRRPVRP